MSTVYGIAVLSGDTGFLVVITDCNMRGFVGAAFLICILYYFYNPEARGNALLFFACRRK